MTGLPPTPGPKRDSVWTKSFIDRGHHVAATLLVDFGSTYTKVAAVDADSGRLLGIAQHPTTVDGDLLIGFEVARDALRGRLTGATFVEVLACSSAGGGLRLAVIGLEPELTAEAARRAALNAGARVVNVTHGGLTTAKLAEVAASRPDIVLLVGGTNGGNASSLLESARVLAFSQLAAPIVLAGNEVVRAEASQLLKSGGKHVVATPNLMPEIGVIQESPVREAIRSIFIEHVIGGKHLSSASDFAAMVLMPTPDAVLTATELLSTGTDLHPGLGDLMVIDLGGATTDVHSVVTADQRAGYVHDLLASATARRTVEADLGLRWNATGILDAAGTELSSWATTADLRDAAARRVADPQWIAESAAEMRQELELARRAVHIAMRRHAGRLTIELSASGAALRKSGRDLRSISTVVLSGGFFRHAGRDLLNSFLSDQPEDDGLLLPQHPRLAVDRAYLLAAAGLLASRDRSAAFALMNQELMYLSNASRESSKC